MTMRTKCRFALSLSATIAAAFLTVHVASAGVHPPEIEARLAALVGDWTIPGQERTYRELCEWYAERAFVVCNSLDASDGSKSVSILGYSKAEGVFTYHNYGHLGGSRSELGFPAGSRGLVYTYERRRGGDLLRSTTYLTPLDDGRLHFRSERSRNGGPWEETTNFHYVRRSATAPDSPDSRDSAASPRS
jgi:hypothetical protein